MLYVRMLITMGLSVYTSRAILEILGITDFGIYNVVGGIVVVLGFLSGSLAGASTRFITYALGEGDFDKEVSTFRTLLVIHRWVAVALTLLVEIVGVWFLFNKMNIPPDRMMAAFWVLQCSVLTSVVSILSVPYNSLIIAHERMDAFAFISVFEAVAKLAIVYALLLFGDADRLIIYAILICVVQITVRIIYSIFCNRTIPSSRGKGKFDKGLTREIASFVGWKINGDLAFVGCGQGINIVLNMFFGPVVNAARGISVQIQNITTTFIQNYQLAVQPQIVKSYASGDISYLQYLIVICSKYGFFLMLLVAYPILMFTDQILSLWLVDVPADTSLLVKIILLVCFATPLRAPMIQTINATGKIKRFQIIEGTTLLMAVPVIYLELKFFNMSLRDVMLTYLFIEYLAQATRIWIVLPYVDMPFRAYSRDVLFPIFKVLVPMAIGYFLVTRYLVFEGWSVIWGAILAEIICISSCLLLGLKKTERSKFVDIIRKKVFSKCKTA